MKLNEKGQHLTVLSHSHSLSHTHRLIHKHTFRHYWSMLDCGVLGRAGGLGQEPTKQLGEVLKLLHLGNISELFWVSAVGQ